MMFYRYLDPIKQLLSYNELKQRVYPGVTHCIMKLGTTDS
jgi:hypothetical protein